MHLASPASLCTTDICDILACYIYINVINITHTNPIIGTSVVSVVSVTLLFVPQLKLVLWLILMEFGLGENTMKEPLRCLFV